MWDELPDDVKQELLDPLYLGRTHGKPSTYAKKCRGPLCRKAERDGGEKKYAARRRAAGKPAPRRGLKNDEARSRDEELSAIQVWHEWDRERQRLERQAEIGELAE